MGKFLAFLGILSLATAQNSLVIKAIEPDIKDTFLEATNAPYIEIPPVEPIAEPTLIETDSATSTEPAAVSLSLKTEWTKDEVIDLIYLAAKERGVSFRLAYALAEFESNLKYDAQNKKTLATGIFQFLTSTWKRECEGDPKNAKDNVNCAMKLLEKPENILHWTADSAVRAMLVNKGFVKCRDFSEPKSCYLVK